MRTVVTAFIFVSSIGSAVAADDLSLRAWQMETKGDPAGAREFLERAAQAGSADSLEAYAQFLDRHHDPAARDSYEKLLKTAQGSQRAYAAQRLAILDLLAGDTAAATRHLEEYRAAGGNNLSMPPPSNPSAEAHPTVPIPGPLRSFARMAALSPDLGPDDVIPALARNVITNGYQAASGNEALEQTEYLKLVVRYLSQARELEKLSGADKIIKIETCDSSQTAELLRVLGYRMRGACGSEVVLETVNATRAFLTIDSGFPLAELEQSLRINRPFTYDYKPTQALVLYGPDYWLSAKDRQGTDFIDSFLGDPSLCRLYLGLSKLDPATADELRKNTTVQKIRAYAHVLDFYGGMFQVRNGRAIVPGGARVEKTWAELVGISPDKGAAFFERLVAKDDGWLASYFDALARIGNSSGDGQVVNYLTDPERLKRFYQAIRGKVTSPGPARPVFRSNTDMMLLTARLRLDPDGKPHIPGGLEVWRSLFVDHPQSSGKYDAKLSKAAPSWREPDDVLEALFALCRKSVENEPLKIFMALSDVDRNRKTILDAHTADRLAREYRQFGAQYSIFAEAPEVSNATILQFMDMGMAVNQIKDQGLRADTAGTVQALVGLWQIFCRQGSIPSADVDRSLANILTPFAKVKSEREVFEGGRDGVKVLLAATQSPAGVSPQDRMIDLLAGTSEADASDAHTQLVEDMIRIFEAQRLISLANIFELVDHLENLAKGEKVNSALIAKTASRIAEIQLPRAPLSGLEKNSLSFGYWSEKHIEAQRKVNLRALIDRAAADPKKLDEVRAMMAPFLRDTLVGLNYVHYAPPGAQVLYTNPLFVRSHDFIGLPGNVQVWKTTEVSGSGWPSNAGGKLTGSLVSLPYALAETEQNFLIPSREQALIWGDLVPQLILSATIQRWWRVTPAQLHWVGLHMDYGETLLAEAALDRERRPAVLGALANYAPPARVERIAGLLADGRVKAALENVMPSELFAIARDLPAANLPGDLPLAVEIRREAAESPQELNYEVISHAFGTPKPTLTNSYSPQLLNLRTFPTLMGYSSRILAESWESNLLYYGALADQLLLPPSQLNVLVPAWTRDTVERIFATHLEDWPALLRSLRLVGEDVRQKARKPAAAGGDYNPRTGGEGESLTSLKKIAFIGCGLLVSGALWLLAQERPTFRIKVDMVVLSFTVTDSKGHYINGLKPADFHVTEDGIAQKINTFGEGDKPPVQVLEDGTTRPLNPGATAEGDGKGDVRTDSFVGTNVFVLFDTSNYMYRGFVYASDAIADFVRGLDRSDSVAVYTFSRNLKRDAPLTRDRGDAIFGLRKAVAGDDAALYNGLLLTLRDAAKVPGRKVIIVFSNGPDNASMVAPDDVRAVAEDEGIPIYVISTNDVNKDPMSSAVFKRISTRTGGKAYFAKTWQRQVEAFESIREDIGNSYTITYYPQANANEGFRKINVEIVSDAAKKYRVRARPGYRPHGGFN